MGPGPHNAAVAGVVLPFGSDIGANLPWEQVAFDLWLVEGHSSLPSRLKILGPDEPGFNFSLWSVVISSYGLI